MEQVVPDDLLVSFNGKPYAPPLLKKRLWL